MEQLEPSGPPADSPTVAPQRQPGSTADTTPSPVRRNTDHGDNDLSTSAASLPGAAFTTPATLDSAESTSHSVPSLRFPRPLGNRELTNWVSSSSPDIMRNYGPQDEAPLDASVDDLSFEFIGTDGESQSVSVTNSDEHHITELVDDVHSIADMTDATGTDAETNDVETDSSDDDGEGDWNDHEDTAEPSTATDSHAIDMESMADRSLEHPTEIFTPVSLSAENLEDHQDKTAQDPDADQHLADAETKMYKGELFSPSQKNKRFGWVFDLRETFKLFLLVTSVQLASCFLYWLLAPHYQGCELSTVPVAAVSSLRPQTLTETLVATSTVPTILTSTSTATLNTLQTTNLENSLLFPFSKEKAVTTEAEPIVVFCSAEVHGRNEILLKVPERIKSAWLARQAILISLSRGSHDISPGSTKVSTVDQGFIIEVPLQEAHGILNVAIATTKKPKINETFQVNFGSHVIDDALNTVGEALDTGKEFMVDFAQTLLANVDDTAAWVEGACIQAFETVSERISGQVPGTPDLVQRVKEVVASRANMVANAKKALEQELASVRFHQAEAELRRQALDAGDRLRLGVLQAQLSSKLWWLKMRGQVEERQRYLAAAELYYREKAEAASRASRSRAEVLEKDIKTQRGLDWRQARRLFRQGGEEGR